MPKCPVCSSPADETEDYCKVCGTNFEPRSKEEPPPATKTTREAVEATDIPSATSSGGRQPSFYLPAFQFLLAVALLGYILFVTTGNIPTPDTPDLEGYTGIGESLECPPGWSDPGNQDGCPVRLSSGDDASIYGSQYQIVLGLTLLLALMTLAHSWRSASPSAMAPFYFCLVLIIAIYLVQGRNEMLLSPVSSTAGFVAVLAMVVLTYSFFLFAVTGRDVGERLASSTYMFLIAGTTVLGAVHYNYVRGPWAAKASDGSVRMYLLDLQPPEMVLILLGLATLLIGIGSFIITSVRLKDLEEAKFFVMIMAGLLLQYLVLLFNAIRTRSNVRMEQVDIVLTVMAGFITFMGVWLFYRKRKLEQSMEGLAYFGIFVAGVGTLFVVTVIPVLLSEKDFAPPATNAEWVLLLVPLLLAGTGLWYGIRYGAHKLRDRVAEMALIESPRPDPFDSAYVPPEDPAETEISLNRAMDRLLDEFPDATIDIKPTAEDTGGFIMDWDEVEETLDEVDLKAEVRKPRRIPYDVDFEELSRYYSTTPATVNQVITHLKSGRNIMLYGEPGTGKTALANLLLMQL
ncbi:MAG TPA: hypothetical protein EYI97_04085, partial [Candidatus Poseidoniales archaeon]|nr:hypothetical protein [Candidatus Poseidoniales archaeon]